MADGCKGSHPELPPYFLNLVGPQGCWRLSVLLLGEGGIHPEQVATLGGQQK